MIIDLLYLPQSSEGYQFCMVLVERLVDYLICMPLKVINNNAVNTAFRNILSVLPAMCVIISDQGSSDFGNQFTKMLCEYGIKHQGSLSHRSQIQGSAEICNKLLVQQLSKICSSEWGKKNWPLALPKAISNINSFNPYRSAFSRNQLIFSPFYIPYPRLKKTGFAYFCTKMATHKFHI